MKKNRCMHTLRIEHPAGYVEFIRCEKALRHRAGRHKGHTEAGIEHRWNDDESNTIDHTKTWSD